MNTLYKVIFIFIHLPILRILKEIHNTYMGRKIYNVCFMQERHDFWPWLWLFFSPFLFQKREEEKEKKLAIIVIKSHAFQPGPLFIPPFIQNTKTLFIGNPDNFILYKSKVINDKMCVLAIRETLLFWSIVKTRTKSCP